MSYGEYHDPYGPPADNNRSYGGQFYQHPTGASQHEQYGAGVTYGDDLTSAGLKIGLNRYARGLDPATGQPVRPLIVGSGGYSSGEPSPLGLAIRAVFNWLVLYPALMIAIVLGIVFVGKATEQETIGAKVLAQFQGYKPRPVSAWLDPKVASTPVEPQALLHGLHGRFGLGQRLDPKSPPLSVIRPLALACLGQEPCRIAVEKLDPATYRILPSIVSSLLVGPAMHGDETAALDACLLALRYGDGSLASLQSAQEICEGLTVLNPRSEAAGLALSKLELSFVGMRGFSYGLLTKFLQ